MKHLLAYILSLIFIRLSAQPVIGIQQYVSGFTRPVKIAHCGDDRLFIVQQNGIIRIIDGQGNLKPGSYLNIDSRVNSNGNEQGLLGLAFHPDYKNNGYFFVNYTYDDPVQGNSDRNTRISRFRVSAVNPDSAVATSEEIVLPVTQPYDNHNGGDLAFGPDGYLYIPLGDGGDGGDPQNHAQNRQDFLGKILRLNVDSLPYSIPPDNPFVNDPSTADEIWALGVRNPWRFSFDRFTGDMWVGDVGQDDHEEVNFQPAASSGGINYGWRCYEGTYVFDTNGCSPIGDLTFPVFDYPNPDTGCTVVGGYVYRGCQYPDLYGYYVFCDYCSGRFWTIHNNSGTWMVTRQLNSNNFRYSSFGEDHNGELYVAGLGNGVIYKVTEANEGACSVAIAGEVITEKGVPVPGVTVALTGSETQSVVTSIDGMYNFEVAPGGSYVVAPSKSNDVTVTNGITTLDLVFTQRHVLGDPFTSPYKIIAAEVNGSNTVSTLDIVTSRALVLAITTSFSNGRLWEFVSSDYVFPDTLNPFPFINNRSYNNISESVSDQNFIGIKLGDVNDSWDSTVP